MSGLEKQVPTVELIQMPDVSVFPPTQTIEVYAISGPVAVMVPVTAFESDFGQAPYTYAGLSAKATAVNGWLAYVEDWKAKGYIT